MSRIVFALEGKKTYIIAVAALVLGILGYYRGDLSVYEALTFIGAGLGMGAMRSGIDASKK